jgi:hypothetical protein
MSYDVVVTERIGETSVETKCKHYKDYIDYTKWHRNISTAITNTKTTTEGRILITLDNWRLILKVGDKVVFDKVDEYSKFAGVVVDHFYAIDHLETSEGYEGYYPFRIEGKCHWPRVGLHNKIYKVIK